MSSSRVGGRNDFAAADHQFDDAAAMRQSDADRSINNRVTDPMTDHQYRSSYNNLARSGMAQIFDNNPLSRPSRENPLAKDWNRLNPGAGPSDQFPQDPSS